MSVEERFKLHCYICDHSCVRWSPSIGYTTFEKIFIGRPDGCRYAIGEHKVPPQYVVWDLFGVSFGPRGYVNTPDPAHVHSELDAAVAATQLLYEDD